MSRKFRVHIGSTKPRNVISKRGSSSSNPKSNRHRLAAKTAVLLKRVPFVPVDEKLNEVVDLTQHLGLNSMLLNNNDNCLVVPTSKSKASTLTSPSVAGDHTIIENDQVNNDENDEVDGDALTSFSRNSAHTELTSFTNCTNPTFDPVHREWRSGSKLHSDVVAVLAAVSEIIHQNNGTESDIEYYGALLSCLKGSLAEDSQKVAATAYLLHLTAKKVPKSILIAYFSQSSKIIYDKLEAVEVKPESSTAIKYLLSSLGIILFTQPASIWGYEANRNLLVAILKFSNNDQPWVRNMSRRVLRNLLVDPLRCSENGAHPAAKFVGEFILQGLQASLETKHRKASVARLLCLLEGILFRMPKVTFRQISEQILQLGTVNDKMLNCAAFQCLQKALFQQPNENCLTTDTNIKMIVALCALATPSDISVCAYWLRALVEAHVCLAAREESKSVDNLEITLQICAKLFRRKSNELSEAVHLSSTRLIQCCIQQNLKAALAFLDYLQNVLDGELPQECWKWVLKTIGCLFQEAQTVIVSVEQFKTLMKSLAEFRDREKNCFCAKEIEELFVIAVQHVGMVEVLTVVPLNITGEGELLSIDFHRTWLIPVLVRGIHNGSLQFFSQYFVPLTMKIRNRMQSLPDVQAKFYSVVEHQIWSILPRIVSNDPKDFYESFPTLCPIIGAALNERSDLRLTLLATIRAALCYTSNSSALYASGEQQPMRRFAKNFLPILFSIYIASGTAPMLNASVMLNAIEAPKNGGLPNMASDQSVKMATIETIKLYAKMTPNDLLITYVKMAVEKIQDSNNSLQKKTLIMDILTAISGVVDSECLFTIFETIKAWFSNRDIHMQKKAYRLLAEIYHRFGEKNSSVQRFFISNLQFVKQLVENGVTKVAACAWPWRIAIFRNIVCFLENSDDLRTFCDLISGEIITYLDRVNSKQTRMHATKCIQEICTKLTSVGQENEETPSSVLDQIFEKLLLNIPENVHEDETKLKAIRIRLIALSVICQRYVKQISASVLSQTVAYATRAISIKNWETRAIALRLVRILCARMPAYCLEQYKELILNSIFTTQTSKTNTVRVRKANVLLFEVLLEKFGVDTVQRYASRSTIWMKQLKNMEKIRRRRLAKAANGDTSENANNKLKKRKKDNEKDEESSDNQDNDKMDIKTRISSLISMGGQKRLKNNREQMSDSDDDDEDDDDDTDDDEMDDSNNNNEFEDD